jgi:hypothetical protein
VLRVAKALPAHRPVALLRDGKQKLHQGGEGGQQLFDVISEIAAIRIRRPEFGAQAF